MVVLVTGGAGFIGSAVVRQLLGETDAEVVNVDALTYAGNLDSLAAVEGHPRYRFERVDICDAAETRRVFADHRPDAVLHLAAESHVDRSIDGPGAFIQTNVVGTFGLLQSALGYWRSLEGEAKERFRFLHVSTDEVFGSLGRETGSLSRRRRTSRTRRTRPARRRATTSSGPGTTPMGCRRSSPTARTTTGRISSPRS